MKKLIFITLVLKAMTLTTTAHADLYLEPYAGYSMGKLESKAEASGLAVSATSDENGAAFGGKIGYSLINMAFGADLMTQSISNSSTAQDVGAFAMFSVPALFRVSASYFPSSKISSSSATITGTGYKAGIGFCSIPLICINLDYIKNTYKDTTASTQSKFDGNMTRTMIGISVPFDL